MNRIHTCNSCSNFNIIHHGYYGDADYAECKLGLYVASRGHKTYALKRGELMGRPWNCSERNISIAPNKNNVFKFTAANTA